MKDHVRAKLEQTLADHAHAEAAAKLKQQRRQSSEIDAIGEFLVISREIIQVVMQEFVDLLAARGIKSEITTTVEDLTEDASASTASVRLSVLTNPTRAKRAFDRPGFTVFCDKRHRRVSFHQNKVSRAAGLRIAEDVGEAGFDQVRTELLEEKLAAFIMALYA